MSLSRQDRRNIKTIFIFTAFTSLGAIINALVEHGLNIYPVLSEFIIGFSFGMIASSFEIYVFEKKFRRVNFSTLLIVRTLFYVMICGIIILAVATSRIGFRADIRYYKALQHHDLLLYITSEDFTELLIYSVVLSFFVNFIRQINRLLGQNVLFNYIAGRYYPAIKEELIFMFLDLKSSTTIAEKIGLEKNHEFLNDFFHDMTDSILEYKGKIYQYVGDEVVLTWTLKSGIEDLNCVKCFFHIHNYILGRKNFYTNKFGVYPEFKAGIHCGEVLAGEIGDIKKDIVYHGDPVNTAARIQAECNFYNKILLISKDLLDKLDLNGLYKVQSMGSIILRGKKSELELFSVEESIGSPV